MTVMVDAMVADRSANDDLVKYLLELADTPPARTFLYADQGPPSDVPRRPIHFGNDSVDTVDGWVVTKPGRQQHVLDVVHAKGEEIISTGLWLEHPRFNLISRAAPPDPYLAIENPLVQMRADTIAVLAAERIKADIFVTERPFLLGDNPPFSHETTILTPRDALPIVGLYLRQQDSYILRHTPYVVQKLNRFWFFWAAARQLVPVEQQWTDACVEIAEATDDEGFSYLAQTLLRRVDGALRGRDRLHAKMSVPLGDGEEVVAELDLICLWLVAAFDVAAQVAHVVLGIPDEFKPAAWQNKKWFPRVAESEPGFAVIMGRMSDGERLFSLLREVRNTIHGTATDEVSVEDHRKPVEIYVSMPQSRRQRILETIENLGGAERWGVPIWALEEEEDLLVHPGVFVEELIPRACSLLNSLLAATPFEQRLRRNLDLTAITTASDLPGPFSPHDWKRVLMQLGL
jgi:hypothetical protein